jgi:hypothetical protein
MSSRWTPSRPGRRHDRVELARLDLQDRLLDVRQDASVIRVNCTSLLLAKAATAWSQIIKKLGLDYFEEEVG